MTQVAARMEALTKFKNDIKYFTDLNSSKNGNISTISLKQLFNKLPPSFSLGACDSKAVKRTETIQK